MKQISLAKSATDCGSKYGSQIIKQIEAEIKLVLLIHDDDDFKQN